MHLNCILKINKLLWNVAPSSVPNIQFKYATAYIKHTPLNFINSGGLFRASAVAGGVSAQIPRPINRIELLLIRSPTTENISINQRFPQIVSKIYEVQVKVELRRRTNAITGVQATTAIDIFLIHLREICYM
ncbi:MAG: hypothetical protein JGK17_03525 [Microcoleus sp. PH2017_10_PVI_O_A]|uniref:hypothetical protein n=1 Tax=unclassified Microcoleus TaxID=2642155 RepID=UPI001D246246|nr:MULTISPECIES: hypothetical protein [unclassified Microcoleus]TAE85569.1 MAG: hypothetical protein EAZ83_02195 [Oscillatoriales cyanobacterium]MCC3404656.1 hypothetical protein [Microcoleus sp. PH2017_10_PVI_O_A]MCC3458682.1 hypothetical protein [Microcoleus sp. PH2017_11_PCY_U_A]MCC3476948.1 hypothetical protein [Microcoleus sp. PH2017_12_PCY_D_A]MCC3526485.1 hypothetical protein [Microcoleus sp. PH2017_21_RUC_O_A]